MTTWKLGKLQWLVFALSAGVASYALVAYSLVPLGNLVHPQMKLGLRLSITVTLLVIQRC